MMNPLKKRIILVIFSVSILLSVLIIFLNEPRTKLDKKDEPASLTGISFLYFGENSFLDKEILKKTEKLFGNAVLDMWSPFIIDTPPEISSEYMPELKDFTSILGAEDFSEISGKNSIKISFPYSSKYSPEYKDVELIFSNLSKKPLKFSIEKFSLKKTMERLNKKYGEKKEIKKDSKIFFIWKKDKSFIVSEKKETKHKKEYLKMDIYYSENITDFIRALPVQSKKDNIKDF